MINLKDLKTELTKLFPDLQPHVVHNIGTSEVIEIKLTLGFDLKFDTPSEWPEMDNLVEQIAQPVRQALINIILKSQPQTEGVEEVLDEGRKHVLA